MFICVPRMPRLEPQQIDSPFPHQPTNAQKFKAKKSSSPSPPVSSKVDQQVYHSLSKENIHFSNLFPLRIYLQMDVFLCLICRELCPIAKYLNHNCNSHFLISKVRLNGSKNKRNL